MRKGGTGRRRYTAYPWGTEPADCSRANYYTGQNTGHCADDTNQVGSYPSGASPYGVMEMAGNVFEWVNDWYQSTYYATSPYMNPLGPESGIFRVLRGGSWGDVLRYIRVTGRYYFPPARSNIYIGFRCAATAP